MHSHNTEYGANGIHKERTKNRLAHIRSIKGHIRMGVYTEQLYNDTDGGNSNNSISDNGGIHVLAVNNSTQGRKLKEQFQQFQQFKLFKRLERLRGEVKNGESTFKSIYIYDNSCSHIPMGRTYHNSNDRR